MAKDRRNGVEVGGLRVVRTTQQQNRFSFRMLLDLLFGVIPSDDLWYVLIVYDGPGNPVATRRLERRADADETRQRFVEVVEDMDQDTYRSADWQAVLDSA